MADYKEVDSEITRLRDMLGETAFQPEKTDFKGAWQQIKRVGQSFKGTRYPDQDQHKQAWQDFQELVEEVKRRQEANRKRWEKTRYKSAERRDEIIRLANNIRLPGPLDDLVFMFATMGASLVLEAIMGPFEDRKQLLLELNAQMRRGWSLLSEYKEEMVGGHKKEAWEALNEAKERLDDGWAAYKRERQRAWEAYQELRRSREAEWRGRVRRNLAKLEERRGRLLGVLAHKEGHREELQQKLRDAWSDSFRLKVSGWIAEETRAISDIRDKLAEIESWIDEEREKLAG